MKLGYLLNSLGCSGFDPDIEIECIYSDSRRVTRGSAFVCIHGGQAGLAYLGQAREMGASVMICERELAKEFCWERLSPNDIYLDASKLL